ncbi:MAG: thioredoxin [Verrucomicrobiae bacterium]|nr:thioredoxin [Verrucomicrobiae bacterium]MDW8344394.1 thioredoxin [Verrucomicrobiae bacterium]
MAGQHVLTLTSENFQSEVLQSKQPVLVDFWAEWCGPCKMIAPLMEELAEEYAGRLKVGKVNVDDHHDLATNYGIRAIPTLILFKDGQVRETVVGAPGKRDLERKIAAHLD